jgi:hypothetical protein
VTTIELKEIELGARVTGWVRRACWISTGDGGVDGILEQNLKESQEHVLVEKHC